jgi:hypothetical protein
MSVWIRAAILAQWLIFPPAAPAHGLRSRPLTVAAYYYPVQVSYIPPYRAYYVVANVPVPLCPVAAPVIELSPPYAVPYAAPPSSEPVLPRQPAVPSTREPPRVRESRYFGGRSLSTAQVNEPPSVERCRVGFWNVSNRDLVLTINGERQAVPRRKSVTLDLGREFVWMVEGAEAQRERIPADKSTLEIVLRR